MKKQFKRAIMGLLAGAMVLVLSGCGSKGSKVYKEVVTSDGKTEVTLWYSGGKTAVHVFDEIIESFNDSQEEYHVIAVSQANYDETYEKLQASIASKTAPDLVLLDADKSLNLARKNLLEDINSLIAQDSEFPKEDYLEVFLNQGLLNGKLFALPAYGTTQVMYYNRAVFAQAGIDAADIKTWQDLARAAEQITVKEGGKTTVYGWEPMWGINNMIDAAFSNGAAVFSEDGKTVTINSKEWIEAWDSIRKWIHEDQIMTIHSGGQGWEYWYKTMDDALNGTAGGYTGSSGDQADLDFNVVGAMEQPGWNENPSAPIARALQLVMVNGKSDSTKQGAYEFMKYFSSPDNQAKWSMETGYVAVRKSTMEVESYQSYVAENPHAAIPMTQSMHSAILPEDPTGGKIYDALSIAADEVEIENIPAKDALDKAQKIAQEALDQIK